ncbi:protein arginine N-methyltransferase 6 isoform X1 [Diabrotica undecimpunctata]|uniref:protein arginine N-methyltransferase 6 isoform X1 n=2 Tax=Diabrotica undecimpunctata TaxID=50387 RepID=UPI003B633727
MMEQMEYNDYFESYEDLEIHRLMLEDSARNNAYKEAIFDNKHEFDGKVVLDVGAGTGILSVFCAQAGAKAVYAVEASNTYKIAEEVVKENKFENVIKVLHAKIEDVDLPEKVDIIVSEWMGFYLLHEAMLDSVIIARDKFLKPGGLMFPESATLYATPCSVPSMYTFWNNVAGVSMSVLGSKLRENASQKPLCECISPDSILAEAETILWIDLREVTLDDVKDFEIRHVAVATKKGQYEGICIWFSCTFPSTTKEPVTLSTEPEEPTTHWKQTVIVLPSSLEVEEGSPIAYDLALKRSQENNRRYTLEVTMLDALEVEHPEYCMCHMTKCILIRKMLDNYGK